MRRAITTQDWTEACCGECAKQSDCAVLSDIPACPDIVWSESA